MIMVMKWGEKKKLGPFWLFFLFSFDFRKKAKINSWNNLYGFFVIIGQETLAKTEYFSCKSKQTVRGILNNVYLRI